MDYRITDYGAVGDGSTNSQGAIQAAIDAAHTAGGGRVTVPAGEFLSGTIVLKSCVTLYLEEGATLVNSLDAAHRIDLSGLLGTGDADSDSGAMDGLSGGCFLFAAHAHDIALEGRGTVYGQGDKVFYDGDPEGTGGGLHERPLDIRPEYAERPRTTYFEDIERLTVRGVTFRDAAFWTLHMAGCRKVIVDGIRIENDPRAPNNDGIDPDTCQDVVISNCIVEAGDDAIVVKNTVPMAERYGASENIVISNCVLKSRDSALKIGTETGRSIRNIQLSDCVFRDCSRGVGIWVRDGATIEDIHVHHVSGTTRRYDGGWWGKGEPIFINAQRRAAAPAGSCPGRIRNVSFDNIYMASESCVFIAGIAESPIEDVSIRDLHLTLGGQGLHGPGVFDEQPSAQGVYEHDIPAVYVRHADGVTVSGTVRREAGLRAFPLAELEDTFDCRIDMRELGHRG